jgi:hypothetical protein
MSEVKEKESIKHIEHMDLAPIEVLIWTDTLKYMVPSNRQYNPDTLSNRLSWLFNLSISNTLNPPKSTPWQLAIGYRMGYADSQGINLVKYFRIRDELLRLVLIYWQQILGEQITHDPHIHITQNIINIMHLVINGYQHQSSSTSPLLQTEVDERILWGLWFLLWDLTTDIEYQGNLKPQLESALAIIIHVMSRGQFLWLDLLMMDTSCAVLDFQQLFLFNRWWDFVWHEMTQHNCLAMYWFVKYCVYLHMKENTHFASLALLCLNNLRLHGNLVISVDLLRSFNFVQIGKLDLTIWAKDRGDLASACMYGRQLCACHRLTLHNERMIHELCSTYGRFNIYDIHSLGYRFYAQHYSGSDRLERQIYHQKMARINLSGPIRRKPREQD